MNLSALPFYPGHQPTILGTNGCNGIVNLTHHYPFHNSKNTMAFDATNNNNNNSNDDNIDSGSDVDIDNSDSEQNFGPSKSKRVKLDSDHVVFHPEYSGKENDDNSDNDKDVSQGQSTDDDPVIFCNEKLNVCDNDDITPTKNSDHFSPNNYTNTRPDQRTTFIQFDTNSDISNSPNSTVPSSSSSLSSSSSSSSLSPPSPFSTSQSLHQKLSFSSSSKIAVTKQLYIHLENDAMSKHRPNTLTHLNTDDNTSPTNLETRYSNRNHRNDKQINSDPVPSRMTTTPNHHLSAAPVFSVEGNKNSAPRTITHSSSPNTSSAPFSIETVETPPQSPQSPSCLSTSSPTHPDTSIPPSSSSSSSSSSLHHSPLNLSSSCLDPHSHQEIHTRETAMTSSSSTPSSALPSPGSIDKSHNARERHYKSTCSFSFCDSNSNPHHHHHHHHHPNTNHCAPSSKSGNLGHDNINIKTNISSTENHKHSRKTNFSIDAILSSNFGNENKDDNDNHDNNNPSEKDNDSNDEQLVVDDNVEEHQKSTNQRRLDSPAIKSTNSAFTTVMDLSIKSKPIPYLNILPSSSLSPSSSPTEQSQQHTPTSTASATPPSPPLSSPSSSSTSSLQRSFCRSPQDEDEAITPTTTNNKNNYENSFKILSPSVDYNDPKTEFLKSFPIYNNMDSPNFNNINLEKQFPFLTQHPQFLYPFTPASAAVPQGQNLIKNPSLLIERHFPMLFNTFAQPPGKFPIIFNPHIQNNVRNTSFPPEFPNNPHNIQPHIKPEYKIMDNISQNLNHPFAQTRNNSKPAMINPNRKSQQSSFPVDPVLQKQHPTHPTLTPSDIPNKTPGSNPNHQQILCPKYSLDIDEKLNALLENISAPPPNNRQSYSAYKQSSNFKKDLKFPEKSRNNNQHLKSGNTCKQGTTKSNFRHDASGSGHIGPDAASKGANNDSKMTSGSDDNRRSRQNSTENKLDGIDDKSKAQVKGENPLLPAWVFCTRYSDRPSSGPRSRKPKRKPDQEEKRPRTAFTNDQLMRLKREFDQNRYLDETRRQSLANELGLSESQIKIWFQNKRAKIKKSVGLKNPLAIQLMKQGLYNHTTVKSDDDTDHKE